ncbi:MAG: LysR family transcriptional regulator [Gammaproteobacteria bacterium]|nr:LysR family transcriptional regulator [Gammaproteobacteria bacterium]
MHLTLQQLRLFEAVSRHRSFTRAAEELFLTQPAVSIQIKRLEEQVGLPLFDHVGRKIFLTRAGEELYSASLDILNRVSQLKLSVQDLEGSVKGPMLLSVVSTTLYFMPHMLGAFLQQYPEVDPKLTFTNREIVLQRLQDNQDDFVVMGQVPEDKDVEAFPFMENILVVVAHPGHPLAKKKKISLEQLAKERFIERELGSGTRKATDRVFNEQGMVIEPYMELGNSEAIKQAVMAGLGVAVLSLHSLTLEINANKLVVLNVEHFPIKRRWYAVHLKGKRLPLAAQTFLDFMLQKGNQIVDDSMRIINDN